MISVNDDSYIIADEYTVEYPTDSTDCIFRIDARIISDILRWQAFGKGFSGRMFFANGGLL